ncbi:hypothetical protein A8H35_19325 [Burkholderia thailandensis]|nr:hypothetical protein A8H31_12205 [Burkholderia thailandensis]AWY60544.1 hypothetical protein A8H35_19325 [Burkholderia thailandensis]AWY64594.1 hypothetical protein A8H36_04390 [Burkholderia thailandensis]KVG15048.1 hypothetical protein WJ25_27265 [Burkholderia thailandensis]NOK41319.1 hypothetical protein [Burkholderia thailandensis]
MPGADERRMNASRRSHSHGITSTARAQSLLQTDCAAIDAGARIRMPAMRGAGKTFRLPMFLHSRGGSGGNRGIRHGR